jgi:hypothetical protein
MTTTVLLNLGILAFVLMTGLGSRELNRQIQPGAGHRCRRRHALLRRRAVTGGR